MSDLFAAAGLTPQAPSPLADRLRPQKLDEVVGQDHLLGPDGPIRRMAEAKRLASMILWGPPGTARPPSPACWPRKPATSSSSSRRSSRASPT
jgi:putative ATPase